VGRITIIFLIGIIDVIITIIIIIQLYSIVFY